MKITLSIIKADIASIGGHVCPSPHLLSTVQTPHIACSVHVDRFASSTGGDIAVPMTHTHGLGHKAIHQADLRRLLAGAEVAKKQGLRGAGQDLLKDAFSGIVRGMGPTVAEMEFNEWLAACTTDSSRNRQRPLRIHSGTRCAAPSRTKPSVCASKASSALPCSSWRSWNIPESWRISRPWNLASTCAPVRDRTETTCPYRQ